MNIKTTMRYTHLSEWLATKTQTTKRKIPYNIPYCRILKKKKEKDTNELIYKTEADSQT